MNPEIINIATYKEKRLVEERKRIDSARNSAKTPSIFWSRAFAVTRTTVLAVTFVFRCPFDEILQIGLNIYESVGDPITRVAKNEEAKEEAVIPSSTIESRLVWDRKRLLLPLKQRSKILV